MRTKISLKFRLDILHPKKYLFISIYDLEQLPTSHKLLKKLLHRISNAILTFKEVLSRECNVTNP